MKHLIEDWPFCKKRLENRSPALFLDFDGTLAPIAPTPQEAVIVPENKTILGELAKTGKCPIAVVSGRALEDVRKKVGIKEVVYVGNHGLEIEGPGMNFESLMPPHLKQTVHTIKSELDKQVSSIQGVLLEDKGLTLSLHYRLVEEAKIPAVERTFHKICEPYLKHAEIKIGAGKKVLEVRPPLVWNKGHAVSWLLKEYGRAEGRPITPIYIGDDATDEDAFAILQKTGLTVLVGKNRSKAHYYLEDTKEVTWLLEQILHLATSETRML